MYLGMLFWTLLPTLKYEQRTTPNMCSPSLKLPSNLLKMHNLIILNDSNWTEAVYAIPRRDALYSPVACATVYGWYTDNELGWVLLRHKMAEDF